MFLKETIWNILYEFSFFFFFTDDYVILVQGFLETFPPGVRGENHELSSRK